jgi:hypothetical protein
VPIIFGIKRMRKQFAVLLMMCQRCQRPTAHQIVRLQTWFSLFFVPVIPLGSKYFTMCSLCSGTTKIDRDQAERMQQAAQQQAAQPPQMTPDGPITPYAGAPDAGAPYAAAPPAVAAPYAAPSPDTPYGAVPYADAPPPAPLASYPESAGSAHGQPHAHSAPTSVPSEVTLPPFTGPDPSASGSFMSVSDLMAGSPPPAPPVPPMPATEEPSA